jgi:hypothetical protein
VTLSKKKKMVAVAAGAVSAFLLAGVAATPAFATGEAPVGSAFALRATGLIKISPLAALDGKNGHETTSVAKVDLPPEAKSPIVSVGVLNSEVGRGHAYADVAEVRARLSALSLPAEAISKVTSQLGELKVDIVKAECDNGKGSTALVNAKLGDKKLDVSPAADTKLVDVPGVATVVLNKQTKDAAGSLTVTAISINVLNGTQTVDIASATCAPAGDDEQPAPSEPKPTTPSSTKPSQPSQPGGGNGGNGAPNEPGKAPRPTPVEGHLAVTG